MKSLYKKGMTVEELAKEAHESWKRLNEVSIYLNKDGMLAMATHAAIEDATIWSETIEDVIANLKEEAEKNPKIAKKINYFIKHWLEA